MRRDIFNINEYLANHKEVPEEGIVTLLSFAENKRLVSSSNFDEYGVLKREVVLYEDDLTEEGKLVFMDILKDWLSYIEGEEKKGSDGKYLAQLYKCQKEIIEKIEKSTQWSWTLAVSEHWSVGINNPIGEGYLEDTLLFTAENIKDGRGIYVMYSNDKVGYEVEYMEYNRVLGSWDYEGEFRKYEVLCQSHDLGSVKEVVQKLLNQTDQDLLPFVQYGYWYVVVHKLIRGKKSYQSNELLYFASNDKLFIEVIWIDNQFKISLVKLKHPIAKGAILVNLNNIVEHHTIYVDTEEELMRKLERVMCMPYEFIPH
ncbi:hypothetical protein HX045_04275 [Myroides odoratimimus]|uniref:Uncharacterized protein n=1 Tax=Myroides odoratimimus TaxID=76832 RepID=A0AAI8G4N7_9FLAO|nr:hypothetical protein [Myroides odoratimimus]ALU25981.1 hypothetical protein AS202_07420 [Myroides odoratimimus]EHO14232.1 hypothetical protein HMPREF9714_00494 [Myroides odoratimimus CCUG 12901]MCA4793961.1 hypothetical protein [Myroides odoratimimus]MCA4807163.1 hypothetical protein [Myroides odoratimimus]MCA4821221.1 hypothetical protein [Myroides odoratimimus]